MSILVPPRAWTLFSMSLAMSVTYPARLGIRSGVCGGPKWRMNCRRMVSC